MRIGSHPSDGPADPSHLTSEKWGSGSYCDWFKALVGVDRQKRTEASKANSSPHGHGFPPARMPPTWNDVQSRLLESCANSLRCGGCSAELPLGAGFTVLCPWPVSATQVF